MKNKKYFSIARLCLGYFAKKNYLICLFLINLSIGINSCKKDLLVPNTSKIDANKDKIKSISYSEFLSSINLEKTGVLKTSLSNAGKGVQGKLMSNNLGSNGLAFDTDSVKKLTLGDTVSYVISLKPETPHAVQFRNLTIQLLNNKTTAFLTTYLPTQEWVRDWKSKKHLGFKGEIFVNKVLLEELPHLSGLNNVKNNSNGKLMSLNANDVLLNNNKIALAPGECEIYEVIEIVPYGCSDGNHYPGTCPWEGSSTQGWDPETSWLPGYYNYRYTIINCAPPSIPPPPTEGGGGGGSTTPNPPGSYDPCDCDPVPVSAASENKGGLKLAVAAPNCCDEGGGGTGGGLPPLVDPVGDGLPQRSETVFDEETGLTYTYGNVEDFYINNPGLYETILSDDLLIPNALIAKWGLDKAIQIVNEAVAVNALHQNWPHQLIMAVATWNVLNKEIHFALDIVGLVPLYGEFADIANGAIYYLEGDYINAAMSAASAVPVYGWLSTGGKWIRTTTKTLAKPLTDAIGKVAFTAIKNPNGTIRFIKVAVNSFSHSAIFALKAVKPANNTLTNLSRTLLDQASHRIKPSLQSLKNKIDDIVLQGDGAGTSLAGKKTEALSDEIFETSGFVKHEAHFGSNNGFDGVYIKKDGSGNVQEIIINEAKPVGTAGNIKLNKENFGTGLKAQMSDAWINDVIDKMVDQGGDLSALAAILNANKSKITKTVTGVDKASGEIVVLKLANY